MDPLNDVAFYVYCMDLVDRYLACKTRMTFKEFKATQNA